MKANNNYHLHVRIVGSHATHAVFLSNYNSNGTWDTTTLYVNKFIFKNKEV